MKQINFFVIVRFLIGLMFFVSGTEKLIVPYQNFMYVIQSYDIVPFPVLEPLIAQIFPWCEVIIGGFLILGLWVKFDLFCVLMFASVFTILVGRALIINLPISDCGCFGDIMYLPLTVTLSIDIFTCVITVFCMIFIKKTSAFSLDHVFDKIVT